MDKEFVENLTMDELRERFLLLLDIFKCAICLESVQQPIQCLNGHLLCSHCKAGLEICPTCRAKFSCSKPPHFVSQVIDIILPTRCKYKNCSTIIKKNDDHEKYCGFKLTRCKLLCSWEGPGKDILDHCVNTHSHIILTTEYGLINVTLKPFDKDKPLNEFAVFRMHETTSNNIFLWLETFNDPDTKTFNNIFHFVPNGKPTENILVTLTLKSELGHYTFTTLKLNLHPDIPSEGNSISVPHGTLSNFINKSNTLTYSIKTCLYSFITDFCSKMSHCEQEDNLIRRSN